MSYLKEDLDELLSKFMSLQLYFNEIIKGIHCYV